MMQFSPGYAAFTFPMAIGATALYKLSALAAQYPGTGDYVFQIRCLAHFELLVAAVVIFYVFFSTLRTSKTSLPPPEALKSG